MSRRSSWQGDDEHKRTRVWVMVAPGKWVPAYVDSRGRRSIEKSPESGYRKQGRKPKEE